jgi:hypothetical protein
MIAILYKKNTNAKIFFKPLNILYRLFGVKRSISQEEIFKGWCGFNRQEFTLRNNVIDVILVAQEDKYLTFIYNGYLFRISKDDIKNMSIPCDSEIEYDYVNKHKLVVDYFILNEIELKMPNWEHYYMYDCNGDKIGFTMKKDQLYYKSYIKNYIFDEYDYVNIQAVTCAGDKIHCMVHINSLYNLNFNKCIVK